MKSKYLSLIIVFGLIFFSCSSSGGSDPDPDPTPDPDPINPPEAAMLIFPEEDSECTEGTNFTSTQSDVPFNWNDAVNATSYELVLKNLNTQTTQTFNSTNSETSITILRGTPYSWYIISKNSGSVTAQSETWKFYNAGESITSYAPFPAELISPDMGDVLNASTTSIALVWEGSDVDNDIEDYTVLFGTDTTPSNILAENITSTTQTATVSSGNVYYWRVITNDVSGNNSESEIYQFRVN